jgi:hypothetical protein
MASESSGGRAHVSLTGVLNAGIGEVLKQTMKLATTSTIVRMDLAKLDDADNDGATLLTRALAALKRAKREYVFGSPEHLAGILAAKLVPGERRNEAMWLLLLELYQQAYQQDAFEEAAVNYAVTFEVSPPSWEALPARAATLQQDASQARRQGRRFRAARPDGGGDAGRFRAAGSRPGDPGGIRYRRAQPDAHRCRQRRAAAGGAEAPARLPARSCASSASAP